MEKRPTTIRKIIHIDMDAFFASVEQRDNAHLRGRPVVVGGRPDQRGVVAAASYEARKYGIRSAMPSKTAQQRCADLIFVKPRFDAYKKVSNQIREIFHSYTELVEPLSLDEAFLDVSHCQQQMGSATLIAKEIKRTIRKETGLTASAGISVNKFLAKIATDINKPDGLFLISPDMVTGFVENLEIEKFFGIGRVTAEKMRNAGIYRGADLKKRSEEELVRMFGKVGSFYYHIARGRDERPVSPDRIRKSIGAECSFAEDLSDLGEIGMQLEKIAKDVEERVVRAETSGRTLTLKVKYSDYQQVTRSKTSATAIEDRETMIRIARDLLEMTEVGERKVRLLGLTLSNLACESQSDDHVQLTLDLY